MDSNPRRLARLVPLAVGFSVLGVIAIVWLTGGIDFAVLRAVDWRFLPLALACHVLAHAFWGARVAVVAQAAGTPLRGLSAWATVTAGTFGGAVTPGRIGGEGVKLAVLMREGVKPDRASRILIADRAADLIFFIILGLVATWILPPLFGAEATAARSLAIAGTVSLAFFMVVLGGLLIAPRRTSRLIERAVAVFARWFKKSGPAIEERVHEGLLHVREGVLDIAGRKPLLAFAALGLTAANWIVEFGALWTILLAFGHAVPYWMVFFLGIVLVLVANIPITPGGSGVVEVAALALLTPVAPGLSPLVVVAWRGLTYDYDLLVGGTLATRLLSKRTMLKPLENSE